MALAVRGESPALYRGRRCARLARRDEREYREYLNEEQRSQTGRSAGRMQLECHHGLLGSRRRREADRPKWSEEISEVSSGIRGAWATSIEASPAASGYSMLALRRVAPRNAPALRSTVLDRIVSDRTARPASSSRGSLAGAFGSSAEIRTERRRQAWRCYS
jgi:hypothetical protein